MMPKGVARWVAAVDESSELNKDILWVLEPLAQDEILPSKHMMKSPVTSRSPVWQ